jgi:hypothetical protein
VLGSVSTFDLRLSSTPLPTTSPPTRVPSRPASSGRPDGCRLEVWTLSSSRTDADASPSGTIVAFSIGAGVAAALGEAGVGSGVPDGAGALLGFAVGAAEAGCDAFVDGAVPATTLVAPLTDGVVEVAAG